MDALILLKASLVLSTAILAARLLHRGPAAGRHRLWTLTFTALLVLPLAAPTLPALHVQVPSAWNVIPALLPEPEASNAGKLYGPHTNDRIDGGHGQRPMGGTDKSSMADAALPPMQPAPEQRAAGRASWRRITGATLLLSAWLIGATVASTTLLVSLVRVRRLAQTADDLEDPAWRRAAGDFGCRLGLRRPPRLIISSEVRTPMAGGLWRPVIFLPRSAPEWGVERRDVVLAHEIAHLARRDPLRHLAARLAVAFYWFHPLAWIAARQASVAREQASDETVLALGTRPSAYARVLLELAESIPSSAPALGALPMVERSLLETRLMAILTDETRPAGRRGAAIACIGVGALALAIAAAQPIVRASVLNVAPAPPVADGSALVPETTAIQQKPSNRTLALAIAEQTPLDRDSACWWNASDGSSFSGNISMSESGGRTVIYEQIGTRGSDRVIQKNFGDLRLCLLAEGAGDRTSADRPSQWLTRARRTVLEARRGGLVQRLEIGPQAGGGQRISWRVGSAERPFDADAQLWRDQMLAVLDITWEISSLRGEVSSLRGEISSIRGQESSLRGEISSLRGEVSSMRGRASSIQGDESSLRGEISSIRGHLSSLHGEISSERGAISSLNGRRYDAGNAERDRIAQSIRDHEQQIRRIEQEIQKYGADAKVAAVEREIVALNAAGKVAEIEKEIRAFDLDRKIAEVEKQIAALNVSGKVQAIEKQIEALDVERRSKQLEERRDAELEQLDASIRAIR